MLEILEFMFEDIWHFTGIAYLLHIICFGIKGFISITINDK